MSYLKNTKCNHYCMDFILKEGGRKRPVLQGYRSDFFYDGDEIRDAIYCIHPEFEDEEGNVLISDTAFVPIEGTARMWILFPEMREKYM